MTLRPRQRSTGPLVRSGPRCGLLGGRCNLLARLAERRPRRRRDANRGALGRRARGCRRRRSPGCRRATRARSSPTSRCAPRRARTCRRRARRAPRARDRRSTLRLCRGRLEVEQRAVRLGIELALGRPHRMSSQRRDGSPGPAPRRRLTSRAKPVAEATSSRSPSGCGGHPGSSRMLSAHTITPTASSGNGPARGTGHGKPRAARCRCTVTTAVKKSEVQRGGNAFSATRRPSDNPTIATAPTDQCHCSTAEIAAPRRSARPRREHRRHLRHLLSAEDESGNGRRQRGASFQNRTMHDWLAVASNVPSCAHRCTRP